MVPPIENSPPGAESTTGSTPIRLAEELYRKIVETAQEGIWTIDEKGCTTYVNRRMAEMLGYSTEEMLSRPHTDFMFSEDQGRGETEMELRRQGNRQQWDQRYRRKDGTELWTVASCCPISNEDGSFGGALGMFTDITSRKRTELVLRESEQRLKIALDERDKFLAMLSHELRAPLNPILLLASERAENPELDESNRVVFATIADNARHQAHLIDDLLDLTKIGQGKLSLNRQAIDLRDVLTGCIAMAMPSAKAKGIDLKLTLPECPAPMLGDPDRLHQAIGNVIGNAIKFSSAFGEIQLEARGLDEHTLRVTCADKGMGMTAAELSRVFEPFAQGDHADAGETRAYGGLGLGLALTRMILDLHGATITATSPGRGRGATFAITLPLLAADTPAGTSAPSKNAPRQMAEPPAGFRVLVVEDHAATRAAMCLLLKQRNCEVRSASTMAQALAAAASHAFDLVLCDLGLPDGDGCALMMRLSETYELRGIALTGFGSASDIARSRAAGFVTHLTKPIDVRALDAAVSAFLMAR